MKTQILRRLRLFSALPDAEIAELAEKLNERLFLPGEVLLHEGGHSESFYIQLDGQVEILKSLGSPDERQLAICAAGTLLGEMSLFSASGMHTASARALEPSRALVITRDEFTELMRRWPDIALELVAVLSRRLETSENITIRDLRDKNRELSAAYEQLKMAQAQLIEKQMLERELQIASDLQLSILPVGTPRRSGYDIGALMIPARMVGGDFYDFIPLGPHRLGVVVGDVCDKGIPAALFMTLTYSAMRDEAQRHALPGDALRAVNRRVTEMNATGMFVTMLYGVLDFDTRQFTYARAGHTRPLALNAEARAQDLAAQPGQPVGLFDELTLDEQTLTLESGGTLLLFTDGLSESLEHRGIFDLAEVCGALLDHANQTAQGLCERLWQTVNQDQDEQNAAPLDDFTVVAIRIL